MFHHRTQGKVASALMLCWLVGGCASQPDSATEPNTNPTGIPNADITAVTRSKPVPVGKSAPPFALKRLGGGKLSLSALQGQTVVLTFWTTSCPPCHIEAPHLRNLDRKYRGRGVRVIGITPLTPVSEIHGFIKRYQLHHDILVDPDERIVKAYGLAGYPATFLLDRNGKVRFVFLGYEPGDEKRLEQKLLTLL